MPRQAIHLVDLNAPVFAPQVIADEHNAYFPNLSSDGSFVVFQRNLSATSKQIARWDRYSGDITEITLTSDYAMSPALSSDDRFVVFSRRSDNVWNLWQLDLWTNQEVQLTDTPYEEFAPTLPPSGRIAFASNSTGTFQLYQFSDSCVPSVMCSHLELVIGEESIYAPTFSGRTEYQQRNLPEIAGEGRSSFGAVYYRL